MKYLMRFDHYLEMLIWNADVCQVLCPGHVLDYTNYCQLNELPSHCRIVAFPRHPKPHQIVNKW